MLFFLKKLPTSAKNWNLILQILCAPSYPSIRHTSSFDAQILVKKVRLILWVITVTQNRQIFAASEFGLAKWWPLCRKAKNGQEKCANYLQIRINCVWITCSQQRYISKVLLVFLFCTVNVTSVSFWSSGNIRWRFRASTVCGITRTRCPWRWWTTCGRSRPSPPTWRERWVDSKIHWGSSICKSSSPHFNTFTSGLWIAPRWTAVFEDARVCRLRSDEMIVMIWNLTNLSELHKGHLALPIFPVKILPLYTLFMMYAMVRGLWFLVLSNDKQRDKGVLLFLWFSVGVSCAQLQFGSARYDQACAFPKNWSSAHTCTSISLWCDSDRQGPNKVRRDDLSAGGGWT